MGLKKFLFQIVGYKPESQDPPHIGVRPGEEVQGKQSLQTFETAKVVQEESRQFNPISSSPSNGAIESALKEAPKVEETPKVTIETKFSEVAPQPVIEPIKVKVSKPRGRPRTNGERVLPKLKANGNNTVNFVGASPKPRRTRKTALKSGMTVVSTESQQAETELNAKEKKKEKIATPMFQGS
jgi:hypothetical protein